MFKSARGSTTKEKDYALPSRTYGRRPAVVHGTRAASIEHARLSSAHIFHDALNYAMCESCFTDKPEHKATGLADSNQHIITALYRLALHERSRCAEARPAGIASAD